MISHEALCIITGIPPINIKVEEAVALYNITTGRTIQIYQIDKKENPKYWLHPADTVKVNDNIDDTTDAREDSKHSIQVYTDGSKSERGVGAAVVIFKDDKIIDTKKYKLDGCCSNKQAEQLAILKALENIQDMDTNHKRVQICTDSQIALESLKNRKSHKQLIGKNKKGSNRTGKTELENRI